MSTFQSVVKAKQQNGGPHKMRPLAKNENLSSLSNKEQGMKQASKRGKLDEFQPISVGEEARAEACGNPPPP